MVRGALHGRIFAANFGTGRLEWGILRSEDSSLRITPLGGRYMEESSLRILAQAGLSGVFFAAKILRGELPHYRLPLPEFAAKILPCSAPLKELCSLFLAGDARIICVVLAISTFIGLFILRLIAKCFIMVRM